MARHVSGTTEATVAVRIAQNLDTNLCRLHRLTWTDGRNPHCCPRYVREEITFATTTLAVVVAHDAPRPLEIFFVCHKEVGLHEEFRCICGDTGKHDLINSSKTVAINSCSSWVTAYYPMSGVQTVDPSRLCCGSEGVHLPALNFLQLSFLIRHLLCWNFYYYFSNLCFLSSMSVAYGRNKPSYCSILGSSS